jgi:hypothetical protein
VSVGYTVAAAARRATPATPLHRLTRAAGSPASCG